MEDEILRKRVTPLGDFNCQSYPVDLNNYYEISDEEIEKLGRHELKWSSEEYEAEEDVFEESDGVKTKIGTKTVTKTRPILIPNDPTEENTRNLAVKRIAELKKYLSDTDYQAIKFAEGELSEEDFLETKNQRRSARSEINLLEEALK